MLFAENSIILNRSKLPPPLIYFIVKLIFIFYLGSKQTQIMRPKYSETLSKKA